MKLYKRFVPVVLLLLGNWSYFIYGQNDFELFSLETKQRYLRNASQKDITLLKLNDKALQSIFSEQQKTITFQIPVNEAEQFHLILEANEITTNDYVLTEEGLDGLHSLRSNEMIHYRGTVKGQPGSKVALSINETGMSGVIALADVAYNLEVDQLITNESDHYLVYPQQEQAHPFNCHTTDKYKRMLPLPDGVEVIASPKLRAANPIVEIYIECDYKMFLDKGTVNNVENYVQGLFNVVAGIYDDAGGPGQGPDLRLSELKVWSTPDPYGATVVGNSAIVLGNFICNVPTYNGRIAHLLSTSNAGLGGIAELPQCPGSGEFKETLYGFSNITNSYSSNLNNYSWTVNVLAHELGHNLGAAHTHACVWGTNKNQRIDDCGNQYFYPNHEGECYNHNNPIIPNEGSIMSYCHLLSNVGIDLAAGFHSEVGNRILETANCLSSTISGCVTPTSNDMFVSDMTTSSIRLNCSLTEDVWFYYWGYRLDGETEWTYSDNATSENYLDISITPNQYYEFIVAVYCAGEGYTSFSCNYSFYTGDNPCENEMDVSYNPIPSDTYEANVMLTSSGRVGSGNDVIFDCNQEIALNPGFEVEINSQFTAMIDDGCGGSNFNSNQAQLIQPNQVITTGTLDRGFAATSKEANHAVWYTYEAKQNELIRLKIPGIHAKRNIQLFTNRNGNPVPLEIIEHWKLEKGHPELVKELVAEKGELILIEVDDTFRNVPMQFQLQSISMD